MVLENFSRYPVQNAVNTWVTSPGSVHLVKEEKVKEIPVKGRGDQLAVGSRQKAVLTVY